MIAPFSLQLLMSMLSDHSFNVTDEFLSLESFWIAQTKIRRWKRSCLYYLFTLEPRPSRLHTLIFVNTEIIGAWTWDILDGIKSVILIINVVQ